MPSDATDPHEIGPDLLPTPFSADEIRVGCPAGRTVRLRIESAGAADVVRMSRFVHVDREGAEIEVTTLTPTGEPVDEAGIHRTTWRELQEHAAFPVATTVVSETHLCLALGVLACRLYTVTDGSSVRRFWFAATHPGMPVRYSTEESGTLVSRVTMEADAVDPDPG